MSGRALTLRQLRVEKGWPYSRQHTARLIKANKFLRPFKGAAGGTMNLFWEDEYDAFMAERAARRTGEAHAGKTADQSTDEKARAPP